METLSSNLDSGFEPGRIGDLDQSILFCFYGFYVYLDLAGDAESQ